MSDINYSIAPMNPMPGMMQALQFGSALGGIRDARAQAQYDASAREMAALQKAERDKQISAAYDLIKQAPTGENYAALANLQPPEIAESTRKTFTMLDEAAQKSTLADSARVFAAYNSGNPDLALKMLQEKAESYKNAGNKKGLEDTQRLIDLHMTGEEGAKGVEKFFGLMISQMPGGKDAIDAVAKFGAERRDAAAEPTVQLKRLVDIGLTDAQAKKVLAETKLLDQEFIQTAGELELAKKSGGLDPEKKFASELSLNKEYEARTKAYNESLRLNSVIKDSAAAATGAGDLALINTFMKMLDPGSVVRESEFAQAQDTSGLISKLAASLGKVKNGEVLVPAQRTEFARLANQYMTAAGVHEKKVRDSLNFMVESYGLNPKNVFGTMADGATTTPETATGTTGTTGAATTGTTGAAAVPKAAETVKTGGF